MEATSIWSVLESVQNIVRARWSTAIPSGLVTPIGEGHKDSSIALTSKAAAAEGEVCKRIKDVVFQTE